MTMGQTSAVSLFTGKLQESSGESKKWRATKIGLAGIAIFTFVGAALIFFRPESGANTVNLITVATGAWTIAASGYVGAQAAIDAKTTGAITTLSSPPPAPPPISQEVNVGGKQ
jgi:hypothetical protein